MSNAGIERESERVEQEHFATRIIVVKIGSSTITEGATKENPLNIQLIENIARQCSHLYQNGVNVVIVSSGAVACGHNLLSSAEEQNTPDRQVEAVFGQPTLIGTWVGAFRKFGVVAGQALITENDLEEARKVLQRSLKSGVVIVNANDAVSTTEMEAFLRLADNDRMAAEVADAVEADTILILTDVDGVLDEKRQLIEDGLLIDSNTKFFKGSGVGTGGMESKVEVLDNSAKKGIRGIIASAKRGDIVLEIARGKTQGCTVFKPKQDS
ncbi:MAG: Glutamate 5-kinase [Candidatus Curtissbacteria bacterium GW2011_GWA1_40_47]|uniref:Aspartate/glutamate/uridylate kinase domain-containing protein n=1 Tax=Candidatus Curtissbacteria bacterium RIFOXYA1_FULL_41_14 TaxID=1797737 RepID=A0A1F5HGL7_9BACT|nr:MAG: Glutamate 5-kinase [Candidatus Curtissbacteria bacterium GW2011_GWB1_40_28]KKR61882.1 MAG: Glutamate 5-kinase [Microgenomates group bacterium GW2011_GWC1_40_35]KKR65958.1 MAG: Glutamate 5-kinase [Candidatus Curtissbacteria bacterium GW2011_GWA1_40_47]KKR76352.1 MAG: Glutamate 5-kinase [Candidatus Curtissbacteria bacterium GW2011_GWD1_40_8]KKS02154.1 MAG: Glutamate 5-kinase [Candidatus Curtissbacteria bacterium GW2011_GWC2_41_21]OGD95952.1 MAG: hypothetical protein A3B52_00565 [Candidat